MPKPMPISSLGPLSDAIREFAENRRKEKQLMPMQDLLHAKFVHILVDDTGKLWVNVDERCLVRIGHCNRIVAENSLARHELTVDHPLEDAVT